MDMVQPDTGQLSDLSPDECWTLAASVPLGRLAWSGPEGPTVVPVNFVVSDGQVHVRTAAYSAQARECDDSPVAFEVDRFDAETRTGWSVLLRGRAHLRFGGAAEGGQPEVWPAGAHALLLTIDVDHVSGRRVG
jgi:nitroimidazol reductase NimA-like FMN-containing flavoprotein (pyridoxamine 5'-phosphate oxidase superfamily)